MSKTQKFTYLECIHASWLFTEKNKEVHTLLCLSYIIGLNIKTISSTDQQINFFNTNLYRIKV